MYPDYYEVYLFILKRWGTPKNTFAQAKIILNTLMDEGWTKVYSIKELVEYIHTSLQVINCEIDMFANQH